MTEEDSIIYKQKASSQKLLNYRECVGEAMKGKKFPRMEDRYKEFCESAKKCSGKSPEEAEAECRAKHPLWYQSER